MRDLPVVTPRARNPDHVPFCRGELKLNKKYQIGDLSFRVEKIDGYLVTVKLSIGATTTLHTPAILFSPIGLREG